MSEFNPRSPKSILGLVLGWLFSLALLLGPYIVLVNLGVQPWIVMSYWLLMLTYLMAAYVIETTPDTSNLGIGGTMINNPFSFEDDDNRAALKIALFLWPGKMVWWTLGRTWRVIRGG
ncbi:MAG: hypothetical protein AAGC44_13065 [Planctomycetota bacterium]